MTTTETLPLDGLAIVGMAGRFPGAQNIQQFWLNLLSGTESITFFSQEELRQAGVGEPLLRSPQYVPARGVLDDVELFDADFFGFTPSEAAATDPQQRLFLECAWEALEDSGYDPGRVPGTVGVYAGSSMNTYMMRYLYPNEHLLETVGPYQVMIGNDKDFMPTRVSFKLNLRGPSVAVQTACSSSLAAVHVACQALLAGECDMALAGGAAVRVPQISGYLYQEGGIHSPDGHCRAFDAAANGMVSGNGLGIVVLKRLEDAVAAGDHIYAVIRGTAMNNDGAAKVGYTAPSVEGQATVIAEAQGAAGVEPAAVSYVETHGTGTNLGDPIEIAALTAAFGAGLAPQSCAIGSVKTNIGHLDAAAGIAGLIKTALAVKHASIPPSLNFVAHNPLIDWAAGPFRVATQVSAWDAGGRPRVAGVSSFGIGGTNVHAVVAEAPEVAAEPSRREWCILLLSARSEAALEQATDRLAAYLRANPHANLADVAYTLQVGRRAFQHRRILVCRNTQEAAEALERREPGRVFTRTSGGREPAAAFLFPGQGAQYVNALRGVYEAEPVFRSHVDRLADMLVPLLGTDVRTLLFPPLERQDEAVQLLEQTVHAQPALFVLEYALAQLWIAWGVQPAALMGHSLGEFVAACLAGTFSEEDALAVVADRAKRMQMLPPGRMLAVSLAEERTKPFLSDSLSLAAVNGPNLCVVAGTAEAVEALAKRLTAEGIVTSHLHTSHAFHSFMMDPMVQPFADQVSKVHRQPPEIPVFSGVTGQWVSDEQAVSPAYWGDQACSAVRFGDGLALLAQMPDVIPLELGPGTTLSTLARAAGHSSMPSAWSAGRHPRDARSDLAVLLETLGQFWLAGGRIDWNEFHAEDRRCRVSLPTYPFQRQRYWVGTAPSHAATPQQKETAAVTAQSPSTAGDADAGSVNGVTTVEEQVIQAWREIMGVQSIGVNDNFFALGGHSLMAIQVAMRLVQSGVQVSAQMLFEHQTPAAIAAAVKAAGTGRPEEPPEAPLVPHAPKTAAPAERAGHQQPPDGVRIESSNRRNALLTGATGYLGVHILAERLQDGEGDVYCLVRGRDHEEAEQRIWDNLRWYFGEQLDQYRPRVVAVAGDIQLERFGLSEAEYAALADAIDEIYHAAADVRHVGDPEHFQSVNVKGTESIIALARTGRRKVLHHISTMGVAGSGVTEQVSVLFEHQFDVGQQLTDPYQVTKYQAEKAVREAMAAGVPTAIYRIGFVAGDHRTGRFQRNIEASSRYRQIRAIIEAGIAPYFPDAEWDYAPVDFVTRGIVKLAADSASVGETFHVIHPQQLGAYDLVRMLQSMGYAIRVVDPQHFAESLQEVIRTAGYRDELGGLPIGNASPEVARAMGADSHYTHQRLAKLGLVFPPLTVNWFVSLVQYGIDVGFFKAPPGGRLFRLPETMLPKSSHM